MVRIFSSSSSSSFLLLLPSLLYVCLSLLLLFTPTTTAFSPHKAPPCPANFLPPPPTSSSSSCACSDHHHRHAHKHTHTHTRTYALPPFDTPLDPATIESMAGAPLNEVTTTQLWVGFIAGVFPFVWAGYEFWKRIDIQQRCGVCQGSGLVSVSATGKALLTPRKCYACGGFLPWAGWKRFWLSNLDIGNGGILQRPAPDYEELSQAAKAKRGENEVGRK